MVSSPKVPRQTWLWVTGPDYYAMWDGSANPDLAPGNPGSWTCQKDTKRGDLVLLYRTAPRSDIAYLFEVTSDAYVNNWKGVFAGDWACEYESRIQFANPLDLDTMRHDRRLAKDFGPLRAKFRRRSFRFDHPWTEVLLSLLLDSNPSAAPTINRLQRPTLSRELVFEKEIEDRLAHRVAALDPRQGLTLYSDTSPDGATRSGRQYVCDGLGRIDLLCHDKAGFVVVEIKRDVVDQRTIGQILAYMGWVKGNLAREDDKVRGIVVGRREDTQFRYAVAYLPDVSFVSLDRIATKLGLTV